VKRRPAVPLGYHVAMPQNRPEPDDVSAPKPEETYELDLPDDDEPAPPPPPVRDVSSDVAAAVDTPAPAARPPAGGDVGGPKVSEALYKHEGDPEFIDPEVARMRREEQRLRAAEQAALDAAAGRRRNIIFFVVALAVGLAVFVLVKMVF